MTDWRKQAEEFTSDMDTRYDGNLKGATQRQYFMATPEGLLLRKQKSEKRKALNEEKYGKGTYTVRSPGNDLLDFYDQEMYKLDPTSKAYSLIPPSVVYHYRFEHKYPEFKRGANRPGRNSYLREKLKDYYYTNDPTYWGQVYTTRFRWLTNTPHKSFEFKYVRDAVNFLKEQLDIKTLSHKIKAQHGDELTMMMWRGKAAGWSMTYAEN